MKKRIRYVLLSFLIISIMAFFGLQLAAAASDRSNNRTGTAQRSNLSSKSPGANAKSTPGSIIKTETAINTHIKAETESSGKTSPISSEKPVPEGKGIPDWDKVHTGYATFTGSGYTGGTSLLDPIAPDMEIAALNRLDYYESYGVEAALGGAYLEVSGAKGKTVVYVCDLYPEGGPGALDLCPTSFAKLDDMAKGKIDISWRIIPAPITGNVSYRIKEGSTQSWLAVQVRNHKYPVLKMEYNKDGQWIDMKKMFWNHFVTEGVSSTTPQIRMTDIRGYVITDTVKSIPVSGDTKEAYIVPGNVQFPD